MCAAKTASSMYMNSKSQPYMSKIQSAILSCSFFYGQILLSFHFSYVCSAYYYYRIDKTANNIYSMSQR
jgi:hypothetical protein